jgi:DNA-binding transcriptional MerR regulator
VSHLAIAVDRERFPLRMKDLCEQTGLDRQTIHFYIQQGLVPEGHKTGRNMAYYGPEHVTRIKLVRELQHERFLPLKAIRAVLDGRDHDFSPEQRELLSRLKTRVPASIRPPAQRRSIPVDELLARAGDVTRDEIIEMSEAGLFAVVELDGVAHVGEDDAWMIEALGRLRAAGLTRELGFRPRDLAIFEEAVTRLVEHEVRLFADRLADRPADDVAALIARTLPIIGDFLVRFHATRARTFFAAVD